MVAIEEEAEAALRARQHDEAIALLQPLVTAQPARERPRSQLMLAFYREGRHADALTVYDDYRRWLDQELGLEPSPALKELQTAVLRREPSLQSAHELRKATGEPPLPHGNLPANPSELIGRDETLEEIADALTDARVVTLTGPGGVGKTSLALRAASEAVSLVLQPTERAAFPDGAWLVELAALDDDATVAAAVSTTLGVRQRSGLSTTERLVEFLRPMSLLLLLDNCEHVIDPVAALVDAIVRGCPHVRLLTTSREPLEVTAEHIIRVPPLGLPSLSANDEASVAQAPAVTLFVERARAGAGFALSERNAATVAEICRRLNGLPLAIELAATRVRSMRTDDLVQRLASRFRLLRGGRRVAAKRHRTLRAVVDWSYELMTVEEQQAFDRLSVFASDFGLAAAEAVAGDGRSDVTDLLAGLVDKSMISVVNVDGATRYTLLETLRAYGRERLSERGQTHTAQRLHTVHYVEFAERTAHALNGPEHERAAESLTNELDELRAAHAWGLGHDLELAVRLVAALVDYVEHRIPPEVFVWAERTIAMVTTTGSATPHLPAVYAVAASGARFRGELSKAVALAEDGLAACHGPNDPARRLLLHLLAEVALFQGRLEDGERIAAELEGLAAQVGDGLRRVSAALVRAFVCAFAGDQAAAVARADEMVTWADSTRNPAVIAWARYGAGEMRLENDPDRAAELLNDALTRARAADERYLAGVALVSAASLQARRGDPRRAAGLFREVIEHWHAAGNWTQQWTTMRNVVDVLLRLGKVEEAAILLGALQASHTAAPAFGPDAVRLQAARDLLTTRLTPGEFSTATAHGAALGDEGALRFACDTLQAAAPTDVPRRGRT